MNMFTNSRVVNFAPDLSGKLNGQLFGIPQRPVLLKDFLVEEKKNQSQNKETNGRMHEGVSVARSIIIRMFFFNIERDQSYLFFLQNNIGCKTVHIIAKISCLSWK